MKFSVRSTLKDVEPIGTMNQNIFADCCSFTFSILIWALLNGAGGKTIFVCVLL